MPAKSYSLYKQLSAKQLQLILVILAVIVTGTYLLVSSHAATPYASNEAEAGTLASGATKVADSTASGGYAVNFSSVGGSDTNLIFDGTFDNSLSKWPSLYGSCYSVVNSTEVQFNLTSSCNPGDDGHYRTDLCSSSGCDGNGSISAGDVYQAGQATCTSVPINLVSAAPVPESSWMLFAESKDYSAANAGWAFMFDSYYTGSNQIQIGLAHATNDTTWDGTLTTGWHTISLCSNNGNNSSGEIYGIYEDGVRLTFNHGTDSGSQTITNYAIINNGMSSWPLDVDDYTGGSPVPNTTQVGAPLISSGSSNPPEPSGGWNSP
jgi:hypothetical protein